MQKGENIKKEKKKRKENAISPTICGVCCGEDAEMTRDPAERKESEGREVKYMARDMYYVDYIRLELSYSKSIFSCYIIPSWTENWKTLGWIDLRHENCCQPIAIFSFGSQEKLTADKSFSQSG